MDLYEQLSTLASQQQVGIKEVFLAAYCFLMKFMTSEKEVMIGLVSNGRPAIQDGEKLLGCFLNSVPFKLTIPAEISGKQLIELTWNQIKELKEHDKLSFLEIAELTGHIGKGNPLFDTIFNFIDFHVYESLSEDISYTESIIESFESTNTIIDLTVAKSIKQEGIEVTMEYSTAFYSKEEIDKILTYYLNILTHIATKPNVAITSDKIISKQELDQLLYAFNNTKADFPKDKTFPQLFEEQVQRTPDNIAVIFEDTQLTYQAL